VARDLGLALPAPIHAGGGTDGSFCAAVGLPILDSMGVRGGRAHTRDEFVVLESLPERAALAAILWRRLIREPEKPPLDDPGGGR
jgi:glutamate carboxypeptidase